MNSFFKNITITILVLFLLAFGASTFDYAAKQKPERVGANRLVEEIEKGSIGKVEVEGDIVRAIIPGDEGKKETILEVKKEPGQTFAELIEPYKIKDETLEKVEVVVKEQSGLRFWISALAPYLVPLLLIIGLMYFMSRQVQGVNNRALGFGQSGARQNKPDEKNKTTFAEVAGAVEAKEELTEIVDFLRDPKKFAAMGAEIPKGVLLMGSPGTGKTLLAKAVAGEANVPFFHISGSEFVEMFVGVGASRVRDLFAKAKKAAPAIVFIDEIDAVGRKRGAGLGGSHDEREQTLNQILVEMDGFEPNSGVIVIAATNRPDVLDSALLRPGRFDRRVVIQEPDIKDREAILLVHAKQKPFAPDVDLRRVAERTPGFTGADLANILNEAAIFAVRQGETLITNVHIFESIEKVLLGPQKKSRIMTQKDKEMTAYHEAGHAIVGHFLPNCDPVRKVSIIGRGVAGGYTLSMPSEDIQYKTIAMFKDEMAMAMGGYVAERMIYGEDALSTGPSSDIKKATQLVKAMVLRYGMSDRLGPRDYGQNEELIFLAQEIHEKKTYSEKTAEMIDAEINRLLTEAREKAETILKEKREQMDLLVTELLKSETVEEETFLAIVGPRSSGDSTT